MDEEKFQRAIDTLLEQQARFYSDLQELKGAMQELTGMQREAEKRTNGLERVCLNLYNTSIEQSKNIDLLTTNVRELRDAQKETDERLNAVIYMAEKFFGGQNGGNGKKKK